MLMESRHIASRGKYTVEEYGLSPKFPRLERVRESTEYGVVMNGYTAHVPTHNYSNSAHQNIRMSKP